MTTPLWIVERSFAKIWACTHDHDCVMNGQVDALCRRVACVTMNKIKILHSDCRSTYK